MFCNWQGSNVVIPPQVAEKSLEELQKMFVDALKKIKTLTQQNKTLTTEKEEAVKALESATSGEGLGPSTKVADLETKLKVRTSILPSGSSSCHAGLLTSPRPNQGTNKSFC
jgi:hypothetical protein